MGEKGMFEKRKKLGRTKLAIAFVFLIFIFVFAFISSAFIEDKTYSFGEEIKIDVSNYSNYTLEILTPTQTFLKEGNQDVILFELSEIGNYTFILNYSGISEIKKIEIFEDITESIEEVIVEENNTNDFLNETSEIGEEIEEKKDVSLNIFDEEISNDLIFVGKPVLWKKKIILNDSLDELVITVPNYAENVRVYSDKKEIIFNSEEKTNKGIMGSFVEEKKEIKLSKIGGEVEVTYETPAPIKEEKEINENKKEVVVSSDIHYENVFTTTKVIEKYNLEEKDLIKIYWTEENKYLDFLVYDTDENGLIDEIGWTVPHLSTQTFEIILISKAEHLDENRIFIEEVYEEVKEIDYNFVNISNNEYLRVTFEKNLTSEKDITLYARGNGSVQVYKENSEELITEFPTISEYNVYKIYLTNLSGEEDTFDLKVLGEVEFDYVVDPTFSIGSNSAQDVALTALDNRTFVVAWIPPGLNEVNFQLYDVNGTNLTGVVDVSTVTTVAGSRVSLAAINSSAFVIVWNDVSGTAYYARSAAYNRLGTRLWGPVSVETSVGSSTAPAVDVNVISMGDRYQVCYIDDAEADADIRTYLYSTPTTSSAELNLDAGANPDTILHNLFECSSVNSSRFVAFWFDDSGDTASYAILNQDRTILTTQTNLGTAGTNGQVAITTLNHNSFAMTYYDSSTDTIKIAIYYINNSAILGVTTVDSNAGTDSRVSSATVKSSYEDKEWFVVAWNDQNEGKIKAAVYNYTGVQIYNYTLAEDENSSRLLFDIYGRDSANNISICDDSYLFTYVNDSGNVITKALRIDGSEWDGYCGFRAPTVNITSPENKFYNTSNITFQINVTNSSPIDSIKYSIDTGITNISLNSIDGKIYSAFNESVPDGNYTANFYVFDVKGNSNLNTSVNFSVDTTSPIINIISPENKNYNTNNILVNYTVVDLNKNSCYYSNNSGETNYSISNCNNFTYVASEGETNFTIYANDSSGNVNFSNITFVVDTVFPKIEFLASTKENNSYVSEDYIYINVSAEELNEANISFNLYNDEGIIYENIFTDNRREITWNLLSDDVYYYNVSIYDTSGNLNFTETRKIILDNSNPVINFDSSTFQNNSNISQNYIFVNVSIEEINEKNITFNLYNSTEIINSTTYSDKTRTINWTNLLDGTYYFDVTVYDFVNKSSMTETRQINLDTIYPKIEFSLGVETNNSNFSRNYIYVNVSAEELNEANISFNLYNLDGIVYENVFTNKTREINWTSLSDGAYYYNVSVFDFSLNLNYTETRKIGLDTTSPTLNIIEPKSKAYGYGTGLSLNYTVSDNLVGSSQCFWNLDNNVNQSISCGTNTTFDTTDGAHTLHFYVNDTLGNLKHSSVVFSVSTTGPAISLLKPQNNFFFNISGSKTFEYSVLDPDGVSSCGLYGDWGSGWHLEETDYTIIPPSETNDTLRTCYNTWGFDCSTGPPESLDNTFDSCSTGIGTDESVEEVYINATSVYPLDTINVTCTFDPDTSDDDTFIWYYNGTGWRNLFNHTNWGSSTITNESVVFTVDNVTGTHWVRCGIIYNTGTDADECMNTGSYYDNDDINFTVLEYSDGTNSFDFSINDDGGYLWNVLCNDTVGYNSTSPVNFTFTMDTTYPKIEFGSNTNENDSLINENYIYVNVTVNETNEKNITFNLYGDEGIVYQNTFTDKTREINWTNLVSGNYSFNVTIYDFSNNFNYTETRKLRIDLDSPQIEIIHPETGTEFEKDISFNVTLNEKGFCNMSLNNGITNFTMNNISNEFSYFILDLSDGDYLVYFYCEDLAENYNSTYRTFSIDSTAPIINFSLGTEENESVLMQNFVYLNTTVTEVNEVNITFYLYNSTNLVYENTFTDKRREINWALLSDGDYYYNVTIYDLAGLSSSTETRKISLDHVSPVISYNFGAIEDFANKSQNWIYTEVIVAEDYFENIIFSLYNDSGIVNETTFFTEIKNINWTLLSDGIYYYNVTVFDKVGLSDFTVTRTITLDTTNPEIIFSFGTEENNTNFERDYIYANVSISELNFKNVTFELWNSSMDLINNVTFENETREINWSLLNSENSTYYYKVSSYDFSNNYNSTELRQINLIDITPPTLNLLSPLNKTYYIESNLSLNYDVYDVHLESCWYNIDGGTNISLPDCNDTKFDVTQGGHTLYLFVNDSMGYLSKKNVTFIANVSLLKKHQGILAYGEGTIQTPRYRIWNGTNFLDELTANTVGGTLEWVSVKNSPSRDEYMMITADANDDVNLQIYGELPNGTTCWHNGTTCGVYELTAGSSAVNRQKMDIAYETIGEDALIVWSQGNSTPMYSVWNGTGFSSPVRIPQTLISVGDISYLRLASHPFKEEIALIMTNNSAINILIWDGSSWGCEPEVLPSTTLTPEIYQHADLAYEQVSGDLFVAHSIDVTTEVAYTTKAEGVCSYTTSTTMTLAEEGEQVSVGARYGGNEIMIVQRDITGADLHAIIWDGIQMKAISGNEASTYTSTPPSLLTSAAFAGTTDIGILTYSDYLTSLVVDYLLYNTSSNTWTGGTTGLDATGITSFSDEEQNIKSYSYVDENKTLIIVQDDADDLWAKGYNGETNSFYQPDGGVSLETTVSSTTFPTFDFEFDYDRSGPSVKINSPVSYLNSTSVTFNITTYENATICSFSVDDGLKKNMNRITGKNYVSEDIVMDGEHNVSFTCEDEWENTRTTLGNFTVDSTLPLINFVPPTYENNSNVESRNIFVNVSVIEVNEKNITFNLYNSTGLMNSTTYSDKTRTINWTNLNVGNYSYEILVYDYAGNYNVSERRYLNLFMASPIVNLGYPYENNISSLSVEFNFSVNDDNNISNCSLYGNWNGGWHLNQTLFNPLRNQENSFEIITLIDGFYLWNVYCIDVYGNFAFNSTNLTFGAFLPPYSPEVKIYQTSNDGKGNIILNWTPALHTYKYRIYSSNNVTDFIFINETFDTNYTDTTFNGNNRRFYKVESFNPTGSNMTEDVYAAHLYVLNKKIKTKNFLGFPTNFSLEDANSTLNEINGIVSVNSWNETLQKKVTCNDFSCPTGFECTDTNCNFLIIPSKAYEVDLNSSGENQINWSGVGVLYDKMDVNLNKNLTSYGKNWVSMYAGTNLVNARGLMDNVSYVDAVTRWDSKNQASQGYIYTGSIIPWLPPYVGTNFNLTIEEGYEISVKNSSTWRQR